MLRRSSVGTLTFTVTADDDLTNVLAAEGLYRQCDALVFYTTEDAFNGTITLIASYDGSTYVAVQEITRGAAGVPGAVAIPAQTVIVTPYLGWTHMALSSDGTEGDDADIGVVGLEYYYD